MLPNHDDIEKLFQDSFDGFEVAPDTSVKDRIDHALFSGQLNGSKKRGFLWIGFTVLLLGSLMTFFLVQDDTATRGNQKIIQSNEFKESVNQSITEVDKVGHNSVKNNKNRVIVAKNNENNLTNPRKVDKFLSPKKESKLNTAETNYSSGEEQIVGSTLKNGIQSKDNSLIKKEQSLFDFTENKKEHLQSNNRENKVADNTVNRNISVEQLIEFELDSSDTSETKHIEIVENSNSKEEENKDLSVVDAASQVEEPEMDQVPNKSSNGKWLVGVFVAMEQENVNAIDDSGIGFVPDTLEFGSISTSIFDFRLQAERLISENVSLGTGIGYALNNVTQNGKLFVTVNTFQGVDTVLVSDSTGSVIDTNYVDVYTQDLVNSTYSSSYRLSQFVLPIYVRGFYKWSNFGIGLSAGVDLSFSSFKSIDVNNSLSNPQHNSFGASVWLRPEVSYQFNRFEIVGYGSMRSRLKEQLIWEFINNRKASFGGGIAIRYYFR